jgi:hypothetical protein
MDFWFEFLNIHMNGKTTIYHDCHGFKYQNINICPILIVFLCSLTSFLAHWIVISPWNPITSTTISSTTKTKGPKNLQHQRG